MEPERWAQVSRIFNSAIELDSEARDAYVERECGADESLAHEVKRLIENHQKASAQDFIAEPAFANQSNSESRTLAAGQRLGPYLILQHLGTGGMGEVYLATDARLDRRVALKVLSRELAHDKRRMQRFQQEARMASALNQPNILTIFEFGEINSLNLLATEYIEGQTLRQYLRSHKLKLSEILDISIQILSALDAAHEAKIVHRDIKPENVMIRSRDHVVKVLDFGLAKPTESGSSTHASDLEGDTQYKTAAGTVLGTVNYMSPEQAQGFAVDERTDLWSTGVVIYEMVTGQMPFKGRTKSHILVDILENEPVSLSEVSTFAIPDELTRIVDKALAKQLDERYQTAKDMLIDLRKLRKQLDVEAEMRRSVGPALVAKSQTTTSIAGTPTVETGGLQTSKAIKYVILLFAAIVVGGGIWFASTSRHVQEPPSQTTAAPVTKQSLTYSITVQKYRNNKPFEEPFQLAKEMLFERDYQIRLNVNGPKSGYLYILNEGPHEKGKAAEFVVLFPSPKSNGGSALINDKERIQIPENSWITFDQEKGTERVWLVFCQKAVADLEPIRGFVNDETKGLITDSSVSDRVQQFLRSHSTDKPTVEQNTEQRQTRITSTSDILVHAIDLEHQ
ncbi:MAG TPA: protein kinase [Pyrinomonadaceae bacterium]|nr:protein kinase [Pyrinomonadaceae bacterium]